MRKLFWPSTETFITFSRLQHQNFLKGAVKCEGQNSVRRTYDVRRVVGRVVGLHLALYCYTPRINLDQPSRVQT